MKIAGQSTPSAASINAALTDAARGLGISVAVTPLARAAEEFVTYDEDMKDMRRVAELLSQYEHPVLILGETGTGKELIARILHGNRDATGAARGATPTELRAIAGGYSTGRRDSFFAVNCSGIPAELFESLLFGHERGAFTGAVASELGILQSAARGTAFLDEVGDLPLAQQTKLLRVLQTRRVRPVGSAIEVPISCRFVFATNRDLKSMVRAGTFREDLYYRISTFVLRTKPLRDRPCDVGPIARRICAREKLPPHEGEIPAEVYAQGNVRALTNWLLRKELLGMDNAEAMKDL